MTKTKLFLDDVRKPYDDSWELVKDYPEFVEWVNKNGVPLEVSFDHDLAYEHYYGYTDQLNNRTGYDCAVYLKEVILQKAVYPEQIIIHSWNPDGAKRIYFLFKDLVKNVVIREY